MRFVNIGLMGSCDAWTYQSNREGVRDEAGLLAFVPGKRAHGGTGAGAAASVGDLAAKHHAQ